MLQVLSSTDFGEKNQKVVMEHVHITYDENPQPGAPAMLDELSHVQK